MPKVSEGNADDIARVLIDQLEAGAVLAPDLRTQLKRILEIEPELAQIVEISVLSGQDLHARVRHLAEVYIKDTVGRPGQNKLKYYEELDKMDNEELVNAYLLLLWNYLQETHSLREICRMCDFLSDARPSKITGYTAIRDLAVGNDNRAQMAKKILMKLRDLLLGSPTIPTQESWHDQKSLFAVAYGTKGMYEVKQTEWSWARDQLRKMQY